MDETNRSRAGLLSVGDVSEKHAQSTQIDAGDHHGVLEPAEMPGIF